MADLTTNYVGLKLKSPLIAGSAGITETVEIIEKALKDKGIIEEEKREKSSFFNATILKDKKSSQSYAKVVTY